MSVYGSKASAPAATAMLTVGVFAPQFEVLMVSSCGALPLPSTSVAETEIWYVPCLSGTKLGVAAVGESSCAALPDGFWMNDHAYENGSRFVAPQATLGSVNDAVSVNRAPTFGFAGTGVTVPVSGSTTAEIPTEVPESCALPQVATESLRNAGADSMPREFVATAVNW